MIFNFDNHILRRKALMIVVGTMMPVLLLTGSASAATITVNDSGGADYTRIQDAINAANDDDIIQVMTGTYSENVVVNKSVILRGENNLTTIINGNGSSNVVEVIADRSTIDRFRIRNGSNGIYVTSSNNVFSNNVIMDMNGVQGADNGGPGSMSSGIYLFSSTNNTIKSNAIRNITGGIGGYGGSGGLSSGIYFSNSIKNTLTGNIINNIIGGSGGSNYYSIGFDQGGYGIYLENNSYQNLIYSTNTVDGDPTIYLYDVDGAVIENYVLTANSNPTNLGKIILINSSNSIIRNNNISNMKGVSGTSNPYGGTGLSVGISSGIYLSGSTNIKLLGNTISNIMGGTGGNGEWHSESDFPIYLCGSGGISSGIYLYKSPNNTIVSNTITNIIGGAGEVQIVVYGTGGSGGLSAGIYMFDSPDNIITGNAIKYLSGGVGGGNFDNPGDGGSGGDSSGIYLSGSLGNTLTDNTISHLTGGTGNGGKSENRVGGGAGSGGTSSGIYLSSSKNNTIGGNMISNITGSEGASGTWVGGSGGDSSGIYLSVSSNNAMADNMISIMTGGSGGHGIEISGSGGHSSGIFLSSSPNNAVAGNIIKYLRGGKGESSEGNGGNSGGNSIGIYLSDSMNSNLTGNLISNTIKGTGGVCYADYCFNNGSNGLSAGVYLSTSDNNTLNKNNVTLNEDYGIYLISSTKNLLSGNNASNNNYGISLISASNNNTLIGNHANSNSLGIFLNSSNLNTVTSNNVSNSTNIGIRVYLNSSNNTISDNKVNNSRFGMFFVYAFNTTAFNNKMENNSFNFGVGGSLQSHFDGNNIDTSNLANGRPVYYIKYGKNTIYDYSTRASTFFCILCNNVTVKDLEMSNMDKGIYFWSTSNSRIQNIIVKESGWGIFLRNSPNNSIQDSIISTNNIYDYYEKGVSIFSSDNNTFVNNTIISNNYGIELSSSSKNTIYNNYFNNTNNFLLTGNNSDNAWNITKRSGKNIIGGSYLGGNLWGNPSGKGFSQTCTDSNADGLCDLKYSLNDNNSDNLTLKYKSSIGITINSPNGGENWMRGTTQTIRWTSVGSTGTYVKIELLKAGVLNRVIIASTLNDGLYPWPILTTQTPGSDYKVRITSTTNAAYSGTSEDNFTIPVPTITVLSPNGSDIWTRGTTKTIKWNSTGSLGTYVKIELLKPGKPNQLIISATLNDGSHPWIISAAQAPGSDYKVKITSTINVSNSDTSDNFTIPVPSYTIVSPAGGDNWKRGKTRIINWTSTENPKGYVKIELLKAGVLNRVITSATLNDGSHPWLIPTTQIPGRDYKIRITSTSNPAYTNSSKSNFSISI